MKVYELIELLKAKPLDYVVMPGLSNREGLFVDNENCIVVYASDSISHITSVKLNNAAELQSKMEE